MTVDNELLAWREEWKLQVPDVPPDLAGRVTRQSRILRLALVCEVLITVVMGGGTVWLAINSGDPDFTVLAVATWMFIAAAWVFGLRNRRGSWSPVAMTNSAYLDISIRRCRGGLRAAVFGMSLFVVEMLFNLGWIYNRTGSPSFLHSLPMTGVGLATVLFFAASLIYRARKKAELDGLVKLAAECVGSE
jgi:hypothetical protein